MRYEDAKADKEKMEYLKTTLAMLEARSGSLFEEGFDPEVEVMRLSLDPVNVRSLSASSTDALTLRHEADLLSSSRCQTP
jgi:hypothetical protein